MTTSEQDPPSKLRFQHSVRWVGCTW
jgi:hypothetical protein